MEVILAIAYIGLIGVAVGLPTMEQESSENEVVTYNFPFVTRKQWDARNPKEKTALTTPVPYVVIHHSYIPKACYDQEQCSKNMRKMQDFHMDNRSWWDIGYNFGVGSDGKAYEGRGWDITGAHSLHFNDISIGICLIGDWSTSLPPAEQLKTAKALINAGVQLGYIKPDYKLVGHRQVRETACPGDALYSNLLSWSQYSQHPSSAAELKYVEELPDRVKALLNKNNSSIPSP